MTIYHESLHEELPRLAALAAKVAQVHGGIDANEVAPQPKISVAGPIATMEHEHDDEALAELRALTEGYEPPPWSCATVRALYYGQAELESAVHVHVHLENNVLVPRALRVAAAVNS